MKTKLHFILSMLLIFMFAISHAQEELDDFPILKGPYLGQKPPGKKVQPLPPTVNSLEGIHWQLSVDKNGNLYFGTWKQSKEGKYTGNIYCSSYENGQYKKPEKLGPEINIPGHYNRSPFIAPDGSYLLFNSQDASKMTTLLICFRKSDGTWTKPKDLCNIMDQDGGFP